MTMTLQNAEDQRSSSLLCGGAFEPLIRRLPDAWTAEYCFRRLSVQPGCVWLDSALPSAGLSRFSYLAADPIATIRVDQSHPDVLTRIGWYLQQSATEKLAGLPPMQGGWMGWFGYEMGSCFERIPCPQYNEFHLPMAALGMYDVVLSWDHDAGTGWLVSQGWPAADHRGRQLRAYQRMQHFLDILEAPIEAEREGRPGNFRLHVDQLAPQFATRWNNWTSNFSARQFRSSVSRCVEYIHAGDVFQVNLAQRLLRPAGIDSASLYMHLRQQNPAPFAGYADFGRVQVASASPERFLQLQDSELETRPIKGTRPRLSDPVADAGMAQLLQASVKDRSENTMIVDLMRNDMSRISTPESVKVDKLCGIEKYPSVWHLVSVIRSQLQQHVTALDVIAATFPGGSITGAPKIRAMQIISELEPTARGPYCGSLGYISCAGDMDLNILIRTITVCDGWWQMPVGGGIVADSEPGLEEQETWHKAEGLLRAIDSIGV
ncbi:MAG: aminodeoxychorismate synthase component I [Planctomycetales bacterium]|nr:aminodeoxychorismate synthase component I [Planctomycetales bacterium]